MPGEVLDGKYTIGEVIGSGGMGTVYEAVQNDSDRRVAIKVLHSKYSKSPKIVERFQREARFAGSIEHDNICRVIDHGTSGDGAPYLVMPLLNGRPLGRILEKEERLSSSQMVDIACQTLQALAAAHHRKVVHRDLKPDNIFISRVGERENLVKLLDFGISKVLENDNPSDLTATGMVLGTAYYLAPEQARGSKKIDQRVDVYAMGVILYEALTGGRPFEGDTYNEVVFKIAGDPVKPPRVLNPEIPQSLERVILKAMAIDPGARFSSAEEMCRALEQATDAGSDSPDLEETLADTDIEGARAVSKPERKQNFVAYVLVSVLVLVLVTVLYLVAGQGRRHDNDAVTNRNSAEIPETAEHERASKGDERSPHVSTQPETEKSGQRANGAVEPSEKQKPVAIETNSVAEVGHSERLEPSNESSEPRAVTSETGSDGNPLPPSVRKNMKSPQRRGTRRAKKEEEDVIKGPFNSKFVL